MDELSGIPDEPYALIGDISMFFMCVKALRRTPGPPSDIMSWDDNTRTENN